MQFWRISAARFVANDLSELEAAQSRARWSSRGTAIGYMADTVALAMLELLVDVDRSDVPVGIRSVRRERNFGPTSALVEAAAMFISGMSDRG